MINTLDHLIVAVKDLDEAERNYQKVFGVNPVWKGEHKELGTANSKLSWILIFLKMITSVSPLNNFLKIPDIVIDRIVTYSIIWFSFAKNFWPLKIFAPLPYGQILWTPKNLK